MNTAKCALVVVDAQCGFSELCPAELPVAGAVDLGVPINRLLAMPWARIDASQDWHPRDHASFADRGGPYPAHCVADTYGADFLPGLITDRFTAIWRKGYERDRDCYSLVAQHPGYPSLLWASGVSRVVLCGIATNICVLAAAKDLRAAGLEVVIVLDACAGIDVPGVPTQAEAQAEGEALGIRYLTLAEVLS